MSSDGLIESTGRERLRLRSAIAAVGRTLSAARASERRTWTTSLAFAASVMSALAMLTVAGVGCGTDAIVHTPRYSLYRSDLAPDSPEARVLIARGYALEEQERWAEALGVFNEALFSNTAFEQPPDAFQGRGSVPAFEARREMARCQIMLGAYLAAHGTLSDLLLYYRDFLRSEAGRDLWPPISAMWWTAAMALYYEQPPSEENPGGTLARTIDHAVLVLEGIVEEEPFSRTAASAHVLVGRAMYHKGDFRGARDRFLLVVDQFQVWAASAEEALYLAAFATLASMKGPHYDSAELVAVGGDQSERGALDLCNDYDRQYSGGRFSADIARLRNKIKAILAFRQATVAWGYSRRGQAEAARWSWRLLIHDFGDETDPEILAYVEQARHAVEALGPSTIDGIELYDETAPAPAAADPADAGGSGAGGDDEADGDNGDHGADAD